MSQSGYLVIADISGYTAFLSQSELEHAKESLDALLSVLVEYTRRPLLISRLEGDAVISYALDDTVRQGQTVVELVENTFVAFRKARQLMIVNTTCQCQACRNIPNLDLKFFIHHGTYSFQKLGEHQELLGTDVNLIHRLTKNRVTELWGLRAYAIYTAAAVSALGLAGFSDEMQPHSERYEHLGQVDSFVQDLEAIWRQAQHAFRFEVKPEETIIQREGLFPLPPTLLWPYLTQPETRAIIYDADRQAIKGGRQGGRIGRDVVYECVHGSRITRNTIVDWQPFEQITTIETSPVPRVVHYVTYRLVAEGDGTRLGYFFSKGRGPFLLRQLSNLGAARLIPPHADRGFAAFGRLIEQERGLRAK